AYSAPEPAAPPATTAGESATLPKTGTRLPLLAGIGTLLLAAGLALTAIRRFRTAR
ncbi:MAG: LPXTG cell wall anchor domain-containing protein, partial [Thermoanaerobaculia bacterium]